MAGDQLHQRAAQWTCPGVSAQVVIDGLVANGVMASRKGRGDDVVVAKYETVPDRAVEVVIVQFARLSWPLWCC